MLKSELTLIARIMVPLATTVVAYGLWRLISNRKHYLGRENTLLMVTYIASRLGIWLMFTIYLQDYVTTSDPRLFYMPQLEHFLAGKIPIRDFYYPYAPLLFPAMLPFYLLAGHSIAGISLFAIFAEGVALFFLTKIVALPVHGDGISRPWLREVFALYLLNPATLYWTVFQGYHSIVQTAYAMGAYYFLLRGYAKTGYATGLLSLAGSKLIAFLDWPAILVVCRPRLTKLCWGAIPLVLTYTSFQLITGDIFFPLRYHLGYTGEGNVWYLITAVGDFHGFYTKYPGNLLPILLFGFFFLLGFVRWLRCMRSGLACFSFQAAMGVTTFTMSLFFLFSLYAGSYYVPMLMLPASIVVTSPALKHRWGVWSLFLISGLCVAGDAIWAFLGQPDTLIEGFSSGVFRNQFLTSLLSLSILIRLACFVVLAQIGLRLATTLPFNGQSTVRILSPLGPSH